MKYLGLIIALLLASCTEEKVNLPKPRIYPKVVYPTKDYQDWTLSDCPFTTELPTYFKSVKDNKQNTAELKHKCWYDLYCEELNTYIHLSYLPFSSRKEFDKLIADAFEMANKHNIKASHREELKIENDADNVHGLIFEIDGPVATPIQFFMTDSTQHFLRGSLYFKAAVNRDSIAPIYDFLKVDIGKMIEEFDWTE